MAEPDPTGKRLSAAIIARIGDFIVKAIQLRRVFLDRRTRSHFFRDLREKKHVAAIVKKRENWKARSLRRRQKSSRARVMARYQRRRITGFHRLAS